MVPYLAAMVVLIHSDPENREEPSKLKGLGLEFRGLDGRVPVLGLRV